MNKCGHTVIQIENVNRRQKNKCNERTCDKLPYKHIIFQSFNGSIDEQKEK